VQVRPARGDEHRGDAVPAGERRGDPESRVEHARAVAWRALNRRDRTELELRGILAEKRVAPEDATVVMGELLEGGFVDDAAFAQRFAEDRRRLDAWGAERITLRLRALGVAPEQIAAAVDGQDSDEEMEAALALLRRRVPAVPATPRERDRALGMLVRKGYALELAYDALRRYAGADEPLD
jgi:regulatory protein